MLINFVYIQRDTPIHRLDPRVKFALLMAYALSVAQTSNLWFVLGGFAGTLLYYRASQLRWAETRRTWIFVLFLCFVFTVVNYFFSGGANVQGVDIAHPHVLFSVPSLGLAGHWPFVAGTHLPLSVESLAFMLTQALRIISVVLLALPITYTTNPNQFGVTFRSMGLGDKVSYAIDLSFRFLPTTVRDFLNTLDAQRARGFEIERLRGGIFGKAARLAPMLVPVIIGSLVGAEDIICAMELRCFGVTKRTWLVELHTRPLDRLFLWLCLAGLLLVTTLDIGGAFVSAGPLHVLHIQGLPSFLAP